MENIKDTIKKLLQDMLDKQTDLAVIKQLKDILAKLDNE